MNRPSDDEYYLDRRTEHVAQGDIFREVPVTWMELVEGELTDIGFVGYGMLITYTSGMMKQPPGTRDYKHPFRLVAPIFSFAMLADQGLTDEQLMDIRVSDKFAAFMFTPPIPASSKRASFCPIAPHSSNRMCLMENG